MPVSQRRESRSEEVVASDAADAAVSVLELAAVAVFNAVQHR